MVNFPTRIPDCDSHSSVLLDLFLYPDPSTVISLRWEVLIMLLPQFPLTFPRAQRKRLLFITQLMTILALIATLFLII